MFAEQPLEANGNRRNAKRDQKKRNFPRGQGKGKDKGCVASPLERYMAKSNRSYKHPLYQPWSDKFDGCKRPTKKG